MVYGFEILQVYRGGLPKGGRPHLGKGVYGVAEVHESNLALPTNIHQLKRLHQPLLLIPIHHHVNIVEIVSQLYIIIAAPVHDGEHPIGHK